MSRFEDARRDLGDGPSELTRGRQRTRFVESMSSKKRTFNRGWLLVPVAIVLLISVLVLKPTTAAVAPGMTLEGTLTFPDGTVVQLENESRAQLVQFDDLNADLVLEQGTLVASVRKHTGRTWRYHAGPWTVRVVGTELRIEFSPQRSVEVSVTEGVVEVTGPGGTTLVRAGERVRRTFDVQTAAQAVVPAPVAVPVPVPVVNEELDLSVPMPVAAPARPVVAKKDAQPRPQTDVELIVVPQPDWQSLLAAGHRHEAVLLAQNTEVLSGPQLLQLADAARLEHETAFARRVLEQISKSNDAEAAEASLLLGRLERDAHRLTAARVAFERSVAVAPEGVDAEQARGRLLEVLLELKDAQAAKQAAVEYLVRHPTGTWAGVARKVVERQ